jgi:hypothetical protein
MPEELSQAPAAKSRADEVKEIYVKAQPGVNEVPDAARDAVLRILAAALRKDSADPAARARHIEEAMTGLGAAVKKTGDSVWHASRGAVQATIEAADAARTDPFDALRVATRSLVSLQLEQEGDFAAAAKGAVQGAIQACEELGLDVQRAARESARAAYETANAARRAAGVKVREVLGQRVQGYATGLA